MLAIFPGIAAAVTPLVNEVNERTRRDLEVVTSLIPKRFYS